MRGDLASVWSSYEAAVSTRARMLEYTNRDFDSNQKLGLRQFGFSAGDLFKKHKRKPNLIMSLFKSNPALSQRQHLGIKVPTENQVPKKTTSILHRYCDGSTTVSRYIPEPKPSFKLFRNECHINATCDKCHTIVYPCYMFQWFFFVP